MGAAQDGASSMFELSFLREGEESPASRKARETFRSSASGRDLREKDSGLSQAREGMRE